MLLLHLPTRGNNVNKSSSCFKSANWKNMTHPVCGSIKQAHKPGPFLHFFHHFLFKFIKILKYAPLQEGTNWAFKAVSQVWPGTDTGDSPWGCCRVCGVRGFQAVRVTNKKSDGSMTGSVASRCTLGDNALLIKFLFSCHNDRRHRSHDKMASWLNKITERRWGFSKGAQATFAMQQKNKTALKV